MDLGSSASAGSSASETMLEHYLIDVAVESEVQSKFLDFWIS